MKIQFPNHPLCIRYVNENQKKLILDADELGGEITA